MTATATAAPESIHVYPPRTIGLTNVVWSEWTKLRTVRSTYWTAIAAGLATIGIVVLGATQYVRTFTPHDLNDGFDAANFALQGLYVAQIALGALGVLTITGEYASGMIRTTLTAVPQRRVVIALKGLVYLVAMVIVGEILSFTTFGIGQAILHSKHAGVSLSDPGVLHVVVGGGLYIASVGLLAFALGTLVRRTAGALASFFGVLFLPSALIDLLPNSWRTAAIKFAPENAGTQILQRWRLHDMLGPWQGLGMLTLYGFVILLGALYLLGRRDA
jgi:ABC-2 type transport system permease protein